MESEFFDADSLVDKGNDLLDEGKVDEAMECFEEALRTNPGDADALLGKASCFMDSGKFDEALEWLDRALELDDRNALVWSSKGFCLGTIGRTEDALDCMEKALGIDPTSAHAWGGKGLALMDKGDFEAAMECFDRVLEIFPDDVPAKVHKANCLNELQRHKEALALVEEALDAETHGAAGWTEKGIALTGLDRFSEAEDCFTRAIEIEPDSAYAWFHRGANSTYCDKLQEALDAFNRCLKIEKNHAPALSLKISVLVKLKRFDEAKKTADYLTDTFPDSAFSWVAKGNMYFEMENGDEAFHAFEKAISLEPDNYRAWYYKAWALECRGDVEEAAACLKKFLSVVPPEEVEMIQFARSHLADLAGTNSFDGSKEGEWRAGAKGTIGQNEEFRKCMDGADKLYDEYKYEAALAAYKRALEIDPESADALRSIALSYSFLNKQTEALEFAERACSFSKDDYSTYIHVWILQKLERYSDAVKVIESAPANRRLLVLKASCLNDLKKNHEALEIIDDVLKEEPEESYDWHLKGDILSDMERYDEAIACFNKSLKVADPFTKGWYCKAQAEEKVGRKRNAILSYTKFLEEASEEEWKEDFEKAQARLKELTESN